MQCFFRLLQSALGLLICQQLLPQFRMVFRIVRREGCRFFENFNRFAEQAVVCGYNSAQEPRVGKCRIYLQYGKAVLMDSPQAPLCHGFPGGIMECCDLLFVGAHDSVILCRGGGTRHVVLSARIKKATVHCSFYVKRLLVKAVGETQADLPRSHHIVVVGAKVEQPDSADVAHVASYPGFSVLVKDVFAIQAYAPGIF